MPKSVEDELSESDRMHGLAVKFRKQGDTSSADKLERKVRSKRAKAIARMGRAVKNPNRKGRPSVGAGGSAVKVY